MKIYGIMRVVFSNFNNKINRGTNFDTTSKNIAEIQISTICLSG